MSPPEGESRLSTRDLGPVLAAQSYFGGTAVANALAQTNNEPDDFAKKNGQHPPDPDHLAEPVTTETSPSEDGSQPQQPISPEDQPPAAA